MNPPATTREVVFFDYPSVFGSEEAELMDVIRDVLRRGAYILQTELEDFEQYLSEFVGVSYAVGVGNGTDALLLALRAAGVGKGDEVILPSHTFVASAAAVHHAGGTPILVDVGDDHLMDPSLVEAAITARTVAIMPVHLNGRVCDMDNLCAIAERSGLVIVEDAAQALGASQSGRKAGSFGKAAGFSFYPAKLLGCFGDGGAVVTDDPHVAERLRTLRNHGRAGDEVVEWSYNSRLDNLQAAVLDRKIRALPHALERRREIAAIYQERLSGVGDLRLPPGPDAEPDRYDVFQNYEMETSSRDSLREFLDARGIGTIVQWGGRAIHQFSGLPFEGVSLPVTERVMAHSLLLPLHAALATEEVQYVCDCVREFFS